MFPGLLRFGPLWLLLCCTQADAVVQSDVTRVAHGDRPVDIAPPSSRTVEHIEPPEAMARSHRFAPDELNVAPPPSRDAVERGPRSTPTHVVRLEEYGPVYQAPRLHAPLLGRVGWGQRIRVHQAIGGEDCATGWLPLERGGFLCARTQVDDRAPSTELLPHVPGNRLVPGTYGKLRSGETLIYDSLEAASGGRDGRPVAASLTVRRLAVVNAGGRKFWRTRHGFVPRNAVTKLTSSRFHGEVLGVEEDLSQPLAWARFRGGDGTIAVRKEPRGRSRITGRLTARSAVRVMPFAPGDDFVQLQNGGWVARDDLRIVRRTDPPPGYVAGERWLDIDVDEQVLVAYEGTRPVYATLISSGRRTHDTPTGVYRIERKLAERTMSSRADDDEPYSVDRVPWTAYFADSFAIHAAYWHRSFGERKSHGCVNLAPIDARHLYQWTAPGVEPGWTEVYGHADQPGSLVRIRSRQVPTPALQGYAAVLAERQTKSTVVVARAPKPGSGPS